MSLKLGIIGNGVVGRATARAFMEHCEVRCWDSLPERRTHLLNQTLSSDLVMICLPTPQREGSLECDTSALVRFFEGLPEEYRQANYVIRSTVPIGFTRKTHEHCNIPNLVHSPEFLTARCAMTDAQMPARNIVGIPDYPQSNVCASVLLDLYRRRFPGVNEFVLSSDESEAVKLFTNGFGAVVIAFWNEIRCLADKLGLDWERTQAAVLADGRIPHAWSKVPGPDGRYGFGGACLPKDLANLVHQIEESGSLTVLDFDKSRKIGYGTVEGVCQAALERNELDRAKE